MHLIFILLGLSPPAQEHLPVSAGVQVSLVPTFIAGSPQLFFAIFKKGSRLSAGKLRPVVIFENLTHMIMFSHSLILKNIAIISMKFTKFS